MEFARSLLHQVGVPSPRGGYDARMGVTEELPQATARVSQDGRLQHVSHVMQHIIGQREQAGGRGGHRA